MTPVSGHSCGLSSVSELPRGADSRDACMICTDSYGEMQSDGKPLILTDCGKYAHFDCILPWVNSEDGGANLRNQSCPHCRGNYEVPYQLVRMPNREYTKAPSSLTALKASVLMSGIYGMKLAASALKVLLICSGGSNLCALDSKPSLSKSSLVPLCCALYLAYNIIEACAERLNMGNTELSSK